jgi:hypothetical protein
MASMNKYNLDYVTTFRQGIDAVESNYVSRVQAYLTSKELGYNNQNFTMSYK